MNQIKKLVINKSDTILTVSVIGTTKLIDTIKKEIQFNKKDVVGQVIDPHEFLYLVRSAINEILVKNPKLVINDIEIIGDMKSLLFCDKISGTALTPSFVLADNRASKEISNLKKTSYANQYRDITQQEMSSFSWFSFFTWFNNKGQNLYNINLKKCFCMSLESYLLLNLTGKRDNIIDLATASNSGLFDYYTNQFSKTILKDLDIPKGCLPIIVNEQRSYILTKGFVPLNDNIEISNFKNQDFFRWEILPKKGYGCINIHISEDEVSIQTYIGKEDSPVKPGCQKVLFSDNNLSSICVKDTIQISNLQSQVIQKKFKDVVKEKRQHAPENIWMVMNGASEQSKNQFALINLNQSDKQEHILDAYLEGVFHMIKMKINQFQEFYDITHQDIFCTSAISVNEGVWEILSNCIQSSMVFINQEMICDMPEIYFKRTETNEKKVGRVASRKKMPLTFLMPELDPISSYARFQTWMSFHKKIFEN